MDNKTSLVILVYNQLDYTQQCLESVRNFTEPGSYEIIVVDNGSTDGSKDWLLEQADIKLILNDENKGFPAGCNQGAGIAEPGNDILLLNNDTIVTQNWLRQLKEALYSEERIGAVGPVTNSAAYYQSIVTSYNSISEMHEFAASIRSNQANPFETRLKLIGYCMLIKRSAWDKVGLLDERFTPGNFEDDDYSFRLIQEGYKLLLCKNTFVHHYGGTSFKVDMRHYAEKMKINERKFEEKWGFNSTYSSFIRHEIISLIDSPKTSPIRVLEVGCACGGTLLKIKDLYPNAEMFGIELNENSAKIASTFADVIHENIEHQLSYPNAYFDYIIFADVLEHLVEPWKVVELMKSYLKPRGSMLVSLPNVMHHTVLKELINGSWTYTDAGLLDRTHLRFFTKNEIIKMFDAANYKQIAMYSSKQPVSKADKEFINKISTLSLADDFSEQASTYQYICRVQALSMPEQMANLLGDIGNENLPLELIEELATIVKSNLKAEEYLLTVTKEQYPSIVQILNIVSNIFYNEMEYERIIPLLQYALKLDDSDSLTLYNLGAFLYHVGEYALSTQYLKRMNSTDEAILALIEDANSRIEVRN